MEALQTLIRVLEDQSTNCIQSQYHLELSQSHPGEDSGNEDETGNWTVNEPQVS